MATSTPYDKSEYWIAPARNFRTSARLHLQHFLHLNTVGHSLDPRIESSILESKQVKIADLGCANGKWLIDLHADLVGKGITPQLDGFDINPAHYPAAAFLPESVTLKTLDVLAKPVPPELVGIYDVVNIRGFTSLIENSNVTPLLSTALALLKPGGWLQWADARSDGFLAESPSPEIPKTACETILHVLMAGAAARGMEGDWLDVLDSHLEKHGFEDASLRICQKRKEDLKAWTEDYLMVLEELHVLYPSKADQPEARMTKEAWADLFIKAAKETEQGVVMHQRQIVIAVGQKTQR